jgi:hypothetical protein
MARSDAGAASAEAGKRPALNINAAEFVPPAAASAPGAGGGGAQLSGHGPSLLEAPCLKPPLT